MPATHFVRRKGFTMIELLIDGRVQFLSQNLEKRILEGLTPATSLRTWVKGSL